VVAYSAVCTHTGCDAFAWDADKLHLKCPCHESEFDAASSARVVGGPAPRRLPALPVKIDGGYVVAAAGFISRPGVIQP
jgi:Rieske Fe-S protein